MKVILNMRILKKSNLIKLFLLSLLVPVLVLLNNGWVKSKTQGQLFEGLETIPSNKVGLLLGTSKYLANGYINLYYQYRIDAAVELYKNGKIEYILVSGRKLDRDFYSKGCTYFQAI